MPAKNTYIMSQQKERSNSTSSNSGMSLISSLCKKHAIKTEQNELTVEKSCRTRGKKINFHFLSTGRVKRSASMSKVGRKNRLYKTSDKSVSLESIRDPDSRFGDEVFATKNKETVIQFECSTCAFITESRYLFQKHQRKVHGKDSFQPSSDITDIHKFTSCAVCDKSFEFFSDLSQHIIDVHNLDNLRCDICEVKFSSKKCLRRHVNRLHGPSNVECVETKSCSNCDFQTLSAKELQIHKKKHIVSKPCLICNEEFSKITLLREHMKIMHKLHEYVCNICGKKFGSRKNLNRHLFRHEGIKSHVCSVCGKRFNMGNNLRRHMETHKTQGERNYRFICSVCGRGFNGKANLDDHMNKHTGQKPHSCPQCGQRFGFRTMLYKHNQFVHSSLRPHVCKICTKSFKSKYILLSHMVTHTGISNFNCYQCMRPFSTSSSLQRHIARCSACKQQPPTTDSNLPASNEALMCETLTTGNGMQTMAFPEFEAFEASSKIEESEIFKIQEVVNIESCNTTVHVPRVLFLCSECASTFQTFEQAQKHITLEHADVMV